ncbi:AraC family transcriptional regulator [Lentzea sp. BCCO 10_0856]|uniref:AraC family transcriptional regulator n=1 Tax=Lentzea miocenica TaxID=3095431 RepID=A0ABU4T1Q8_9PSEU|nr:AraC family transcriptional regulator [Lentzea sp. BCCO 10_0856]MDX8032035.1 AraC family transcriptional regulator [Lentzea sp. BCCO 10_0856]
MRTLAEPVIRHWDFPRGIASVALLLRFGAEHGLSREALLDGSGLTPERLADPAAEINAHQELAVVRNLAACLSHAGVAAGRRYHATTFGVLGHAFLSAATVQDAIDVAVRYLDLSFAFTAPAAVLDGDRLVISLEPGALPGDVVPFLVERDLAAIHTVIGELVTGDVPVLSVDLAHPAPADTREHEEVFGLLPRFSASRNQSVVDASVLTRALPLASPEANALCERQCQDLAARRRGKPGVAGEVRRVLELSVRFGETMPVVARALGLSPRTLRRRLNESGTSYQALLDEVRAERAVVLLAGASVEQTATQLGFAEAASFIHAFRRWYGTTPARYAHSPVGPMVLPNVIRPREV